MVWPHWVLAALALCFCSTCADGECVYLADCAGLRSTEQKLQCIRQCRSEPERSREEEELGLILEVLSPESVEVQESSEEGQSREERRSYSMEHFRWGKPMGRKRRPVKIVPGSSAEDPEESTESDRVERGEDSGLDSQQRNSSKKSGRYRMSHFRWSSPPDKRYGGFMRPFSEPSRKPLLTLLRHVIVKDRQQYKV